MRGHQDGDAFNGHRLGVCVLLLGVGGRRGGEEIKRVEVKVHGRRGWEGQAR